MNKNLKDTATTRYLCAAAHLDPLFRSQVLEKIIDEDNKAFGISYGVDLVPIVKHCLMAQRRKDIRDAIVASLFIIDLFSKGIPSTSVNGEWDILIQAVFQSFFSPFFWAAYAVLLIESWVTRYHVIAKSLIRGNYNPDAFVSSSQNRKLGRKLQELEEEQNGNAPIQI